MTTTTAQELPPQDASTYGRLIALLDRHNAQYRLIDHPAEGRTEIVSPMRGNELRKAAKCIILIVKLAKKSSKYILTVIPGDCRLDLNAVKVLFNAKYAGFALTRHRRALGGQRDGDCAADYVQR